MAEVRPPAGRRRGGLEITIDGQPVAAEPGDTILQAARRADIDIPSLCFTEGLSVHGGCRVCVVEVTEQHRLLPACATAVADDMQVRTRSTRIDEHRRSIVELLLAEGNHVCSVCVANGGCELQDLAEDLGIDHVRYAYRFPELEVDASHDKFIHDPNRCILCTRCVRACAEVEGAFVWEIAHRGSGSRLVAELGRPWGESVSCTDCGKCVQACPTGALFEKGTSVGESRRNPDVLAYLADARAGAWRDRGEGRP